MADAAGAGEIGQHHALARGDAARGGALAAAVAAPARAALAGRVLEGHRPAVEGRVHVGGIEPAPHDG